MVGRSGNLALAVRRKSFDTVDIAARRLDEDLGTGGTAMGARRKGEEQGI